jgi:hypothetical protein
MPLYLSRERTNKLVEAQGKRGTRPPEPSLNDHRIGCQEGSTTALELMTHRLQAAKEQRPKTEAQRRDDLIRENGNLRQEIQFYRTCTDRAQEMRNGAHEIAQKMMLVFLFEGEHPRELDEVGHQLAQELQQHVDNYSAAVYEAEEEWMSFWNVDLSQQPNEMI